MSLLIISRRIVHVPCAGCYSAQGLLPSLPFSPTFSYTRPLASAPDPQSVYASAHPLGGSRRLFESRLVTICSLRWPRTINDRRGKRCKFYPHFPTTSWPLGLTEKPIQDLTGATIGEFILNFVARFHTNWYVPAAFGTLLVRLGYKNSRGIVSDPVL